jgi:hypothetical protein
LFLRALHLSSLVRVHLFSMSHERVLFGRFLILDSMRGEGNVLHFQTTLSQESKLKWESLNKCWAMRRMWAKISCVT